MNSITETQANLPQKSSTTAIEIPCITENVIIRLSGGVDSALLLWLICGTWDYTKKPLTVWPVTVVHGVRNWQNYHAQQVYDFIQDHWKNVRFAPLQSMTCEDPGGIPSNPKNKNNYVDYQENLIDSTVQRIGERTQVFNGVTANPPELEGQKYWGYSKVFHDVWECREKHRDWDLRHDRKEVDFDEKRNIIHCNPFIKFHKGHIAQMYKDLKLVDTLLPLTRSCEGWDYMTNGFTEECGECWWCKEKEWAFNVWL